MTNGGTDINIALRRLLKKAARREAIPYFVAAILVLIAVLALGHELETHITSIEDRIADLGPWALVAFVVLFVLTTTVFIPDTVLCIIAGALFGFGWGSVAIIIGSLIASPMQFALAQYFLRGPIEARIASRPPLIAIQKAVKHDEFRLQLLLRLTPLNPATMNYVLGAGGVKFVGFVIAGLAQIPNLMIEVYFGHAGKHLAGIASGGKQSDYVQDFLVLGGTAMCIVVMVVVSRIAQNALTQAIDEYAPEDEAQSDKTTT
ncbi:MAG: VTT domain-containing protein [Pseudomonadota bacterium]